MFSCEHCGQEWERDPALEVPCPVCGAAVGSECRSLAPSGHAKNKNFAGLPPWGHDERDLLAMQLVPGYGRCPKAPGQIPLFPATPPKEE